MQRLDTSDMDALDLCRRADVDLGVPLAINSGGRGDQGEGEAGDEGGKGELEKNSTASEVIGFA